MATFPFWSRAANEIARSVNSSVNGLSEKDAQEVLRRVGPNHLLTDLPKMTIASDRVDDVYVESPHRMDIGLTARRKIMTERKLRGLRPLLICRTRVNIQTRLKLDIMSV